MILKKMKIIQEIPPPQPANKFIGLDLEKQNTAMLDTLKFIENIARNPKIRTATTQLQMCRMFDDFILPSIEKALGKEE